MWSATTLSLLAAGTARASIVTVEYTVDAGGKESGPLNGLAARATFEVSGNQLMLLLENTSTGQPKGFDAADSLLVSVGFNLPDGKTIEAGQSAVIGPHSAGLGTWSSLGPGDSVATEWAWTNSAGGDLLRTYRQIITTSSGGRHLKGFAGSGSIGGPYGGVAAEEPTTPIPVSQQAVSNSIMFALTLSSSLSDSDLRALAAGSIVEFGSDARYVAAPEPSTLALLMAGLLACGGPCRAGAGNRPAAVSVDAATNASCPCES